MNFELEHKYKMIRDVCRKFAAEVLEPDAEGHDENATFPAENIRKLCKMGIPGLAIPQKYGGAGADYIALCIAAEEIAYACAGTADIILPLCATLINIAGNEEQKQQYLVPLATGEKLGAFCLTEPNAGSDAANQQTIAVRDGDEYVINGTKMFITNGSEAEIFTVSAMTNPSAGLRGISTFIVEKDTAGFSIGTREHKMGIRAASAAEIVFKDVRVPAKNLMGQEGSGFKYLMKALDYGRITIAAQAQGIARAAYDEAVKYSKSRIQFGEPIAKKQDIAFKIADMATELHIGRLLIDQACWEVDNGKDFSTHGAMAKLYCSEMANRLAYTALQIHGGYGYIKDYKVERLYRDARITTIYEGTSEIQRVIISGKILK